MRRVAIMGAGGRDFHDFTTVYRDDPDTEVVAFTAAEIPGIDDRRYPASLAGDRYPDGIPIVPESELVDLITTHDVDDVVFAYSDLSHEDVMHRASLVLSAGASFRLLGPREMMLEATVPVVAVCAVRTGCGKSQTSRAIARHLQASGLRTVLVRHPMPYGDLEAMRSQRFATIADIDAADPTIEEREEYELPVAEGIVVYAGVDYEDILRRAQSEADVILWDGGNNDFPFFRPDLLITVVDPLRAGHERTYFPGETNLLMADVVVVHKTGVASTDQIAAVERSIADANPRATVVRASSPVSLEPGPDLTGARVLVIEDGPTITHGGMPFGAGTAAARAAGVDALVDPRPVAVGTVAETFDRHPHVTDVLPAMGYGPTQLADLAATIAACACDAVIVGTPMDLARLIDIPHPTRRVSYEYADAGEPTLASIIDSWVATWTPTT